MAMGHEDWFLRKLDARHVTQRAEDHRELDTAAIRAEKILHDPSFSIQPKEFEDLYGKENIDRDQAKVNDQKKLFFHKFQQGGLEVKKTSNVLEAITLEHAELSNWLGENVTLLKTTEYDDIFNGVDMIAEWPRESRVLALAVDVTFGKLSVLKKFQRIRASVDQQSLTSIKYFKHADGSYRGERREIPRLIVGISKRGVNELARLWNQGNKRALAAHPVQRALVEQIHAQLSYIGAYAKRSRLANAAKHYEQSFVTVDRILAEKSNIDIGHMRHDPVYQEIIQQTKMVFG